MRVHVVWLLLVVMAGCSAPRQPEDTARRDALVAAVEATSLGSQVDLTATLGADWDRAVVLGAYTGNDIAREVLGFDFEVERVSPWTHTEGGSVVVLSAGSEPVAWFALPSEAVRLDCFNLDGIAQADSTLVLVGDSIDRYLVDPDRPECEYLLPDP